MTDNYIHKTIIVFIVGYGYSRHVKQQLASAFED